MGSGVVILEGLVTTVDLQGEVNISAMGALVDDRIEQFVLRPYQTTRTFENLNTTKQGVFHVTDDVEMLARAAIHQWEDAPRMFQAESINGLILAEACRWYAFHVTHLEARAARTTLACLVCEQGRNRDFFGFNRGKHAVVEAAILASRCEFLAAASILPQFQQLAVLVEKTGGAQERRGFELLNTYVQERLKGRRRKGGG